MSFIEAIRLSEKNLFIRFCYVSCTVVLFIGLYAPFLASSQPLLVLQSGTFSFPFFASLFSVDFYTQKSDLFFNIGMFSVPCIALCFWAGGKIRSYGSFCCLVLHIVLFAYLLSHSTPFKKYVPVNESEVTVIRSGILSKHWEEEVLYDSFSGRGIEKIRCNGKSLYAALFFSIRHSVSIACLTIAFMYVTGVFIGAVGPFFSRKADMVVSRLIEIWEALPSFFILLACTSLSGRKNLFFTAFVLSLFGWTSVARVVRMEILKRKHLPYIDMFLHMGYSKTFLFFKHFLPDIRSSLTTIFPSSIARIIFYEGALSFFGIGSSGHCSIGVLLKEAGTVYPLDFGLFLPPAGLLFILLWTTNHIGEYLRRLSEPRLSENKF